MKHWKFHIPKTKTMCVKELRQTMTIGKSKCKSSRNNLRPIWRKAKSFFPKIDTLPKLEDMTLEAYYYYFPGTAPDPDRPLFWPPNEDEQVYNPNYHQRRSLMVIGCDYFMPVLLTLLRRVVIMAEGQARAYTSGTASMAFVTVPNAEVGKKIAGGLVQNKLAACVNIIPQVTSVYEWEGKIEEDSELILMIKTLTSKVDAVSEFVRKNHPYDCAEVISSPIDNGNPPYLKWISDIVGAEKDSKM